jgi:hypothetical protein
MKNIMGGKAMAVELSRTWETLLEQTRLSSEIEYRVRKMLNRMTPLLDKAYLKTVKGQEMILQCAEKTRRIQQQLISNKEDVYFSLTDLEKTYEDLLKRAYAFRIIAG